MGRSSSSIGAVWLAKLPENARIARVTLRAALRQLILGPTQCSGVQHSHDGGKRSHTKRALFFLHLRMGPYHIPQEAGIVLCLVFPEPCMVLRVF